ncbi:MAG: hypothetical protein ABR991_04725 [Terracidiphilus sp.]|jgi:F0F1-type ATP synthase membrane subunit c/vacuolar-type H+-ATPase subunit K
MQKPVFTVRVLQGAMIVSVLMFFYVLRVSHPPVQKIDPNFQWAIVFCAISSALAGFIVQKLMLRLPSQSLATARNSALLGRWFTGHIVRFATAESVALFGFVLGFMGSTSIVVPLLFAVSLLLLVLWKPGECPAQED